MTQWQRWKGIMKCYPFEEKRLLKWEPPFIVQPKYDGIRCRAVPLPNNEFLLLSSEENPIFSVPHINEALNQSSLPRIEFDGELYRHGMSFEEITSITGRTVNIRSDHSIIQFHIFDIVDETEDQATRLSNLIKLNNEMKKTKCLVISPSFICYNLDEVMKTYDKIIETGYEGIIVRHISAPYVRKRSTWVMKFKPKKEDSYEIIGYQEEISKDGIPKDRLGALVCKSGDGNTFNVGTGFDELTREALWYCKEDLIGSTARVQYQHLTSGNKVPRFPVFVEIVSELNNL